MSSTTTGAGIIEIPAAGDYHVDPRHCTVSFTTRHMFGIAPVRGTFQVREGHVHVADPVSGSSVRTTISAGSFYTGVSGRDVAVRSAQYLDAERHPDIVFASTRLDQVDGRWVLHGTLTVRGHGRPSQVHVDEVRQNDSHLRIRASALVDRYEFGITAMKGMTGRRLTLDLDIRAVRT